VLDTKGKYRNWGDVNYIDYGGDQVRFDPRYQEFEVVRLLTPDSGMPGYEVGEYAIMLTDILLPRGVRSLHKLDPEMSLETLEPTKQGLELAKYVGIHGYNPAKADDFVLGAVGGLSGWQGPDSDTSFMLDSYGLDEDVDIYEVEDTEEYQSLMSDLTEHLRDLGVKEGL